MAKQKRLGAHLEQTSTDIKRNKQTNERIMTLYKLELIQDKPKSKNQLTTLIYSVKALLFFLLLPLHCYLLITQ